MDTNFEHYKVSLRLQERSTTLKISWAADYSYAAKAE